MSIEREYPDDVADETPLQHFAGSVERPRPLWEAAVAIWGGAWVAITELELGGMGKRFEVRVTRMGGPKLPGTPDPVGVTVAQVDDVILERDGERAEELARRAVEILSNGDVPDLMKLSQMVRGGPAAPADL